MSMLNPHPGNAAIVTLALLAAACGGNDVGPTIPPRLEFSVSELPLGLDRSATVELRNSGEQGAGAIEIVASAVRDAGGSTAPGTALNVEPQRVPSLAPGASVSVTVSISLGGTLASGPYDAVVEARTGTSTAAQLPVTFDVLAGPEAAAAAVRILAPATDLRQGDVTGFSVEVRDSAGVVVEGARVHWSVEPASMGIVGENGQFVGYGVGGASVLATVGTASDTVRVTLRARGVEGKFTLEGEGEDTQRFTSDLWLFGDYAYTGTWGTRQGPSGAFRGNALNTWDISGGAPRKVATLTVDAGTVNDVKIRADGKLGILTHEGSNDGRNGVTLFDLSDPARPKGITRFTSGLESGVHNAWLEGDYAFVAVDGQGQGLRILDVSSPARPKLVASYYAGSSFLHDVYVRDGLAFLSHWNAGLVILDVGNGMAGGSPGNPVEVVRLADLGGETHNAWYWPAAGYVFVGEEDFAAPGVVHVVDIRNLSAPVEVATFAVPGQTPHNFWLDEDRAILYVAWYANGIRALDVSGDLLGELDRQGREIAGLRYHGGSGECDLGTAGTCSWAPQLHRGRVWVSDLNRGLVSLKPPS